jgi:hypothetical protein
MAFSVIKRVGKFWKNLRWKPSTKTLRGKTKKHRDPVEAPINTVYSQALDHESKDNNAQVPSVDKASQNTTSPIIDHHDDQPVQKLANVPAANDASPKSTSSIISHEDGQPVANLTKPPAAVSAPELDTEKLHPSRTTTGSESLSHDDDGRRSIASSPAEPFPRLHDEPGLTNQPSQLQTPLSVGHRPSYSSAKKNYYDQDEDRDKVIPRDVLCYLKVIFDGKSLCKRKPFEKLNWRDDNSYGVINDAAQKCLRAAPETIDKEVFRTTGVCKLFERDQEWSSKALENDYQWSEVLCRVCGQTWE